MYSYIAYGLKIASEFCLPELLEDNLEDNSAAEIADVIIRRGVLNPPSLQATSSECYCQIEPQTAYLAWQDGGTFLVRNGREIIIDPLPGVPEQVLRIYLLGAALGLLLHQRGLMTLHASTVVIGEGAIAFVGDRGWGKSTTTAAMMKRGHLTITDDVTALNLESPFSPVVLPGFPQIKLWRDSAISLGHQLENLPLLHPDFDKRVHRFTKGFATTTVPLKCIYVLGFGSTLEIEPLSAFNALPPIMSNWYCARFGKQMLQAVGTTVHFQKCIELINRVKVYSLKRPRDLSQLDLVTQAVEEHFQEQISLATTSNTQTS